MASSTVINFFLLSIPFFSVCCLSASHDPNTKPHPFILPIRKDPATNLFTTSLGIGTPRNNFELVIDLAGENLWYSCDTHYNSSSYHPIDCDSNACPETSYFCLGCTGLYKPGCTNNTCGINAINPFSKYVFDGGLAEDTFFISQSQVSGILSNCLVSDAYSSDAPPLIGLPKTSKGIIGLSRSQLGLPIQLTLTNNLPPKFSVCLPSSNKQGFTNLLVEDGGNYQVLSTFLQTTPLIINPFPTGPIYIKGIPSKEYFIDVKLVKIDGNVVNLNPSLLSIDNEGNGGTKISTMTRFTELETTVYQTFIGDYLKKASERKLKRVASMAPFEACFDSTTIGSSVTGLVVPTIDLVLQGGVQWTIYGANSMVLPKKNVACLAFVDGGTKPPKGEKRVKTSIVIGGLQLEDNLLVFDLASSKLSFSSSLLLHNVTCSSS